MGDRLDDILEKVMGPKPAAMACVKCGEDATSLLMLPTGEDLNYCDGCKAAVFKENGLQLD